MKKLNQAIKEYLHVLTLKNTKPRILYNFLSNKYMVTWYYSELTLNKLNRSHEIII